LGNSLKQIYVGKQGRHDLYNSSQFVRQGI